MTEEEKGFTIKDKRLFTTEGERKPDSGAPQEEGKGEGKGRGAEEKMHRGQELPLPEVSFSSFVLSLSSSVLLHFGFIPDPVTQKKERNLPLAKQTIDILGMLQDKTKGNLTHDEEQLISNILYDLRLRYVEERKKD